MAKSEAADQATGLPMKTNISKNTIFLAGIEAVDRGGPDKWQ